MDKYIDDYIDKIFPEFSQKLRKQEGKMIYFLFRFLMFGFVLKHRETRFMDLKGVSLKRCIRNDLILNLTSENRL